MGETKNVTISWQDELKFEGGEPDGPQILIDGSNEEAPGPMLLVLLGLASCTASDVVHILKKMKLGLERLEVSAKGVRNETNPRRYLSAHLSFRVGGRAIDEAKVRRAIDLSLSTYCSVNHSLKLERPVSYDLELV